jgi:hypothetical protein
MLVRRTLCAIPVVIGCLIVALAGRASASDQPDVDMRFETFCREWLQTVNSFAAKNMMYRKVDQGYVAEYTGYSDALSTMVKNADPVKKTYVGILTYNEVRLQHEGQTPDVAKRGPFYVVSQSPVKALFMYRNGRWQE